MGTTRGTVGGRVLAVLLAVAVGLAACGGPAARRPAPSGSPVGAPTYGGTTGPAAYDAAVGTPVQDPVFPLVGNPVVDALHYDLRLDWSRSRTLTGHETVLFRAARSGSTFRLDLAHPMRVADVRLDGHRVPFAHPGKDLVVRSPVRAGSRHTVSLTYSGSPRTVTVPTDRQDVQQGGWRTTRDGGAWTLQEPYGAYSWFAVNDEPGDKAFYDVSLAVPAPMVGISNGDLLSRTTVGGVTRTHWQLRSPASSYLVTVAIGRYQEVRDTGPHGLPLTYWIPVDPPGSLSSATVLADARQTPKALAFLEGKLGAFPFDTLGILFVPTDSAVETQTMVTIGETPYALSEDALVHELSHQWYGDEVTPTDWSDLWMSEGMAFYLAEATWAAQTHGTTPGQAILPWASRVHGLWTTDGPPAAYRPGSYGDLNVYVFPGMMWDLVRRQIGDDLFWRLVREWPASHAGTNQTRATMTAWWSRQSGQDLGPIFDAWLTGRTQPAWSPQ